MKRQPMPQGYETRTLTVYGDKYAKEKNAVPAYERQLRTSQITITCQECGQTKQIWAWPGHVPLYCSDECTKEARRKQTNERSRRLRERRRNGTVQEKH